MPQMSPADLRTRIEAGQTSPLVVLVGADEVEKSEMAADFAGMVDEGLEAFNVDRFHGGETGIDRIIDAASTLPMMASRRVVLVLEAENLLVPRRESKAADEEQARLEAFLENPPPHATVVFVCGPLDMRRRAVKLLMRQADVVDCGTIADDADAERWVRARAARDRVALEPAAVRALVERAGTDLVRLRGALDRVALYALGQTVVTADDVREAVPAAPEAQAEFGIAKAIWRNDARDALRELTLALDAGASPWFLLGQLRTAAERLPPARVKEGIEAAFRTDLALKSSGGDQRLLLERLVVELAVPARRSAPRRPPRR